MKKKNKTMMGALILTGMGIGAWMMYKKKNPDAIYDMKMMAKDMAYKVADSLEDIDMD